jgi:hypothetical protein
MTRPATIPFQDLTRLHGSIDQELRAAIDTTLDQLLRSQLTGEQGA